MWVVVRGGAGGGVGRGGQNERLSRGQAKEAGDQGYMEAEDLLREGRLEEARRALALAEANWAKAGMMNLGGRPFESAIDNLLAQIDAAAAAGQQARPVPSPHAGGRRSMGGRKMAASR